MRYTRSRYIKYIKSIKLLSEYKLLCTKMVDELLTTASETTTACMKMSNAFCYPLASTLSCLFEYSDDSSSNFICHPSTASSHSDDSSSGPLCHPSTVSFCHSSPLSLKVLCVLRLLCQVHLHLVYRSHRPPAQLIHT